jgi:hypothetical protein
MSPAWLGISLGTGVVVGWMVGAEVIDAIVQWWKRHRLGRPS